MSSVSAVSVTAGLCMITCVELCSCAAHACECTEESGKDCAGGCHAVPGLSLRGLCCMQAHAQHPVSQGGDQLWPGMGALAPRGALSLCAPSPSCPISTPCASRSAAMLLPVCLIWDFLKIMLLFQASSRISHKKGPVQPFFPFCLNVIYCAEIYKGFCGERCMSRILTAF